MKLMHAALFLALVSADARAQVGHPCPDVRASDVPAHVDFFGPVKHCGVGIVIFGVPLSIGGSRCYRYEFVYPAHQECLGVHNRDTACVPDSTLSVEQRRCDCEWIAALGIGIALPRCSCTSNGTAGSIEDFKTALCHGIDP